MRPIRILMACAVVLALSSVAFAGDYYVVRGDLGSFRIVDHKPFDSGAIVQGPFATRDEAYQVVIAGNPIPEGFLGGSGTMAAEPSRHAFWVVRGDLGSFRIVDRKPSDTAAIVQGPFATREQAYGVITARGPFPPIPAGAGE